MTPAHAGVDHVGMNARAITGRREAAIEGQGALADAIQSPRDTAGRLLHHRRKQEAADENAQFAYRGVSRHVHSIGDRCYFGRSIRTMSEFSRERSNTMAFPSGVMSKVVREP